MNFMNALKYLGYVVQIMAAVQAAQAEAPVPISIRGIRFRKDGKEYTYSLTGELKPD